tara:strand:+ start:3073 stop:3405 length:333 start_codon:yes stop_codon:yes gene_type:complete
MNKKYKLTDEKKTMPNGNVVYRIQALRDFNNVKTGAKEGWVSSDKNLRHSGNCWLYSDSVNSGESVRYANSLDICRLGRALITEDIARLNKYIKARQYLICKVAEFLNVK